MTSDHMNRRKGVCASPRQPQGDFGRGSDHAQLGSTDDVNRDLNQRGAYRDAEPAQDPVEEPRPTTPGSKPKRTASTARAASGGTRSASGSNYGDWHPDEPARVRGEDGSARSGDWPAGEKDGPARKDAAEELPAATSRPQRVRRAPPER